MDIKRPFVLTVVALLIFLPTFDFAEQLYAAPPTNESAVDAKIEIVWPHFTNGEPAPVATAPLVNVEVYVFKRGTFAPVSCTFPNEVRLVWAHNFSNPSQDPFFGHWGTLNPIHHSLPEYNIPDEMVGRRVRRTVDGKAFPVWVFNDVPVPSPAVAGAKPVDYTTYFMVEVDGVDYRTNVWAHSADPRTFLPQPLVPEAVTDSLPDSIDGMIQIVWPHDEQGRQRPVPEADLVNIAVDLFKHPVPFLETPPVATSLGTGMNQSVQLFRSLNDGYLEPVKHADEVVTVTKENVSWPRWMFNDVGVSAAQNPANKYYFIIHADGMPTHTTVWAHGADARTYFPRRDVPTTSGDNCS